VTAVKMLAGKGYIKLENYFQDGTKIESASGRYTFVRQPRVSEISAMRHGKSVNGMGITRSGVQFKTTISVKPG